MTSDLHARAKAVVVAMHKEPFELRASAEMYRGIMLLRNTADAALAVIEAAEGHECTMGCRICVALNAYDVALRQHFEREGT